MKCTSCGLPLSPARTMKSCPRCGTPIAEKKSSSSVPQLPFPQVEAWKPVAPQTSAKDGREAPYVPLRDPMEVARSSMGPSGGRDESVIYGSDPFQAANAHVHAPVTFPPDSPRPMPQATPQLDPMWLPTSTGEENKGGAINRAPTQVQVQGRGGAKAVADQSAGGAINRAPTASLTVGMRRPVRRGKNNLGFVAAGLCVILGGLILVFIYFMAVGLPGNSADSNTVNTITTTSSPTTASSPVSSPTPTPFPGQKYIDHAQLASRIDPASHQPIELTTTFKANQTMYIAFQLHPGAQNGAVCLFWYANNKMFIPSYALPVYSNERAAYSYASYNGAGSGYVELYWASTTKCIDKVLAQHVNFTVTR